MLPVAAVFMPTNVSISWMGHFGYSTVSEPIVNGIELASPLESVLLWYLTVQLGEGKLALLPFYTSFAHV